MINRHHIPNPYGLSAGLVPRDVCTYRRVVVAPGNISSNKTHWYNMRRSINARKQLKLLRVTPNYYGKVDRTHNKFCSRVPLRTQEELYKEHVEYKHNLLLQSRKAHSNPAHNKCIRLRNRDQYRSKIFVRAMREMNAISINKEFLELKNNPEFNVAIRKATYKRRFVHLYNEFGRDRGAERKLSSEYIIQYAFTSADKAKEYRNYKNLVVCEANQKCRCGICDQVQKEFRNNAKYWTSRFSVPKNFKLIVSKLLSNNR